MTGVPAIAGALAALSAARPDWLWALLLAVPIVLLHLYRRRRVVVAFMPLLVEGLGARRAGVGWKRLRERASLLLRLAALCFGVLALAGLEPRADDVVKESLYVLVDGDVTSNAREPDGRRRLAHAIDHARALVRSAPWRDVTVVMARRAPDVLVPATEDRDQVGHLLLGLADDVADGHVTGGPGKADLAAALSLVRSLADGRRPARIAVLTARAIEPAPSTDPLAPAVEVRGVGVARNDQGLVALDLVRDPEAAHDTVRIGVRNDADGPRTRDLVLRLDAQEEARRPLTLAPGETVEESFEVVAPRGGAWLRVALEGQDDFAGNDATSVRLAPPHRPSVLVVHDGAVRPFLVALLEALGDGVDRERSGTVHVADLPRAAARDVFVVDGIPIPDGGLAPGAWLFLAPLTGALPFEVGAAVSDPLVWRTSPDHPLLRDLDLTTAYVARGFPVSGPAVVALAEAEGQAVLAEGERDGVRFVVLGLDPDGSDLPLRAALPLLLRNAIRRLTAAPQAPLRPFYRAGDLLRPRLPLPGGPEGRVRWRESWVRARLGVEGETFRVPEGATGEVLVETVGGGADPWRGRTAFVDLDPARTIVPVRPPASAPPPVQIPEPARERWRRVLVVAAALALLLDLILMVVGLRRPGLRVSPGTHIRVHG